MRVRPSAWGYPVLRWIPPRGPNVISMFTNAKYGQIMWLHLVTPGNKLVEVNSQHDAVEMGPDAYKGPTAKYDVNKTYHVTRQLC